MSGEGITWTVMLDSALDMQGCVVLCAALLLRCSRCGFARVPGRLAANGFPGRVENGFIAALCAHSEFLPAAAA